MIWLVLAIRFTGDKVAGFRGYWFLLFYENPSNCVANRWPKSNTKLVQTKLLTTSPSYCHKWYGFNGT